MLAGQKLNFVKKLQNQLIQVKAFEIIAQKKQRKQLKPKVKRPELHLPQENKNIA